jgi:hypothetical protein
MKSIKPFGAALLALVSATTAQAALKIDGRIDEPEWASAKRITDFRMVQAADARAGDPPDRGLGAVDARRPGDRLQERPAGRRAAHPATDAARCLHSG